MDFLEGAYKVWDFSVLLILSAYPSQQVKAPIW